MIAAGDVLTHGAVLERARAYGRRVGQPYDFRPMFAEVRPIVWCTADRARGSALLVEALRTAEELGMRSIPELATST